MATVFDGEDYTGPSLDIVLENNRFITDGFNDLDESIQIYGPCRWLFYQHVQYEGTALLLSPQYYPSPSTYGDCGGNQLSSARAIPPLGVTGICLFEGEEYNGDMLCLYESTPSFNSNGFNDRTASVIVTGGTWKLYAGTSYRGASTEFVQGHYPSLSDTAVGVNIASGAERIN